MRGDERALFHDVGARGLDAVEGGAAAGVEGHGPDGALPLRREAAEVEALGLGSVERFKTGTDAVLALTFSRGADHGTGAGGFITTTEPIMLVKLLFGEAEPEGMVVKELPRDEGMDNAQWKDLAGDQGANQWVRMMLLATMKTSENNTVPNNWGDPLLQYQYGMRYGAEPEFVYDTLVLPRATHEEVTESNGSTSTSYNSVIETKAGEAFDNDRVLLSTAEDREN